MILRAYGDSWTEGQGFDITIENTIKDREDLRILRNEYSWAKIVSDELNIPIVNRGFSGRSNNRIFNDMASDIINGVVTKNDFVIVMWSSTLRDIVPFFPDDQWICWSNIELNESTSKFLHSNETNNNEYNNFLVNYKEFFIGELFTQDYYNIINQNYIIFLQKLLDNQGIKYLMFDGIESMIMDLVNNNRTEYINKKHYWNFGKLNMKDYLKSLKRKDIYEPGKNWGSTHPNKLGYELIASQILNFIEHSKVLDTPQ
jgi:hypothetical protein